MGDGKLLLKKIMEDHLPREIIYRKKMGFPVPTQGWFRRDLMPKIKAITGDLKNTSCFKKHILDELISRHVTDQEDHSKILMSLLVIAEWKRQYLQ